MKEKLTEIGNLMNQNRANFKAKLDAKNVPTAANIKFADIPAQIRKVKLGYDIGDTVPTGAFSINKKQAWLNDAVNINSRATTLASSNMTFQYAGQTAVFKTAPYYFVTSFAGNSGNQIYVMNDNLDLISYEIISPTSSYEIGSIDVGFNDDIVVLMKDHSGHLCRYNSKINYINQVTVDRNARDVLALSNGNYIVYGGDYATLLSPTLSVLKKIDYNWNSLTEFPKNTLTVLEGSSRTGHRYSAETGGYMGSASLGSNAFSLSSNNQTLYVTQRGTTDRTEIKTYDSNFNQKGAFSYPWSVFAIPKPFNHETLNGCLFHLQDSRNIMLSYSRGDHGDSKDIPYFNWENTGTLSAVVNNNGVVMAGGLEGNRDLVLRTFHISDLTLDSITITK